jgi:WD40 repeat protein
MADVFVSYSRRDSEFVRRLAEAVGARGKEVWVDTEGIADGEVFPEAIKRAIEQTDAFLFVITPASVGSAYCEQEVEYARELQKRIVPVLRDPVSDAELPAEIRDRNWIPFTEADEFDASLGRLVTALDTDLDAAKAHTRWLVKALEWDTEGRDRSFLLRGSELKAAEAWLAASPEDADPAPTPLQREYLLASRESAARRQRLLVGASMVVAAVSIGLLIFAVISRSQAVSAQTGASAQALAAESQAELPNDPEISLILGQKAVSTKVTSQTLFALRAALDSSPFERAYTTIREPGTCGFNAGLTAALSPDGRQIAEGTCGGMLKLVDFGSGHTRHRLRAPSGVVSLAYSPNGRLLAVGTERQIVLVNPATGAVVRRRSGLTGHVLAASFAPGVAALAFTPDGRELATIDTVHVDLWSVPSLQKRVLATYGGAAGDSMAFTPNGRELIVGGSYDNAFKVYDTRSGRLMRTVVTASASQGAQYVLLAISRDGRSLAVGYATQNSLIDKVSLYSTRTWRREFDVTSIPYVEISALDFSPDGSELAVGAENGAAQVWSLITREKVASYAGPTAAVGSMVFTPGGRSVVTASNDGTVRLWRALGVEKALVPVAANIGGVGLSGTTLLVSGEAAGKSWLYRYHLSPSPRLVRSTYLGRSDAVAGWLSANGRVGVTYSAPNQEDGAPARGPLRIYEEATNRVIRTVPGLEIENAVLSRDGSLLFLQLQPPPLQRRPTGRPPSGPPKSAPVPTLEVMNTATGRVVRLATAMPCGETPRSVAFSPNGGRVAGGAFCGYVEVWNARTGRLVGQVNERAELSSVDLNSDGSRLLVGSWDSRATIWNVKKEKVARQLIGHTSGIDWASFAGDRLVVTAALDDTVRVWDAETGAELRVLNFAAEQQPIVTSPNGQEMALGESTLTLGADDDVRVFATCPACEDAKALLREARPHIPPGSDLTVLEKAVVRGANG